MKGKDHGTNHPWAKKARISSETKAPDKSQRKVYKPPTIDEDICYWYPKENKALTFQHFFEYREYWDQTVNPKLQASAVNRDCFYLFGDMSKMCNELKEVEEEREKNHVAVDKEADKKKEYIEKKAGIRMEIVMEKKPKGSRKREREEEDDDKKEYRFTY